MGKATAAGVGAAAVGGGVYAADSNRRKSQEKQAAVGLLVETGIDFDMAVNMVEKKASELDKEASLAGMARRASRKATVAVGKEIRKDPKGYLQAAVGGAAIGGAYGAYKTLKTPKKDAKE